MINSAASRTAAVTERAPSCHARWSVQSAGLVTEILKRGALDVFHLALTAIARIEILLEEGAEIDFVKGVLLVGGRDRILCPWRPRQRDRRSPRRRPTSSIRGTESSSSSEPVFHHLGVDHVLELNLVERKTDTICTRPGVRICRATA